MIEKVVPKNIMKLKLLTSIRIYPVINISKVVRYRKSVKKQRVKESKPVKVDKVKEQKVEKILNKKKLEK